MSSWRDPSSPSRSPAGQNTPGHHSELHGVFIYDQSFQTPSLALCTCCQHCCEGFTLSCPIIFTFALGEILHFSMYLISVEKKKKKTPPFSQLSSLSFLQRLGTPALPNPLCPRSPMPKSARTRCLGWLARHRSPRGARSGFSCFVVQLAPEPGQTQAGRQLFRDA